MKTRVFLLAAIIVFSSCNDEAGVSLKTSEAAITIDIPISDVSKEEDKSVSLNSSRAYAFSGTSDYELQRLVNPSHGISNIYRITTLQGAVLTIPQIEDESSLQSLLFHWGYKIPSDVDFQMKGEVDLLSLDFTVNENTFVVYLDEAVKQIISEIEDDRSTIKFSISGNSGFSLKSTANLQIPLLIESEIYSPRFELF